MLDDIRFAAPAVAKKAYVEDLTHFRIKGGRITGFDGRMTLSSEIGVDLDVRPNAAKFLAAVRACEGPISLHVTPAGKLAVRAEKFKVFVDCLPEDNSFESLPEGETIQLSETFLKGLRLLSPAIGVDASRPWATGIKVHAECMYATNNVIFAQFWHGSAFPFDVVIPGAAVEQLLRIGTPPTKAQVCAQSLTFWFDEKRWLKTTLLEGDKWPLDKISGLMDAVGLDGQEPFPEGFFQSVGDLKPFLSEDHGIYLRPNLVSTSREDGEGASFETVLGDVPELQCYSFQQLEILGQIATSISWKNYPKACMFTHGNQPLRGLIMGRHL